MELVQVCGLDINIDNIDYTANIISSTNAKGDIIIPRSIMANSNEYVITSIESNAFYKNEKIISVQFSEDSEILNIGKFSFAFSSLEYISIPSSVIQICDYSFSECKNLKTVEFIEYSNLRIIGKNAFLFCKQSNA